jgi:LysM repeat protein
MNIIENYMTKNRCFKQDKRIVPIGVMVHSDGCKAGTKAKVWYNKWNNVIVSKAVHFFIDDTEAVKYLHAESGYVTRGWHCAGKGNDLYVAFEMCEPKDNKDKIYFEKIYKNAVELTAHLLKEVVKTDEVNDTTVLCHADGYKKGIASNHADIYHWWKYHNKTMDDFRNDVKLKLIELNKPIISNDIQYSYDYYIINKGDTLSKIALTYNTTIDKLMKLNNLTNVNLISIGQKLTINKYQIYVVKNGDTLSKISLVFLHDENRFKDIMKWNSLSTTIIRVGQKIRIKIE